MQNNNLKACLSRQFYQEMVEFRPEEQVAQNLYLRQFGINEDEIPSIGEFIEKEVTHKELADRLITRLENEDNPNSRKLSMFVHKLLHVFSSYEQDESYAAWHFNKLKTVLRPFFH